MIISYTTKVSESVQRLQEALSARIPHYRYGCGVDKLQQYQFFKDNNIFHPRWTTDKEEAASWGTVVMARSSVRGQRGSGLQVVMGGQQLPDAAIYTEYLPHKREFRVNLFKDRVVSIREKVRQRGVTGDFHIRNQANGYITTHCRPDAPRTLLGDVSLAARKVSGSDFVGVDIGYNEYYNRAFVIEVNSGPSIEGSSVALFVEAIIEDMGVVNG